MLSVNEFKALDPSAILAAYTIGEDELPENWEVVGRSGNAALFKTPCGAYAVVSRPRWMGDITELPGVSEAEIISLEWAFGK